MTVHATLARLQSLWQQGGARALGRRVAQRLLYRRWVSLVYDGATVNARPQWPDGFRYSWHPRLREMDAAERQRLHAQGGRALLGDLDGDDALYVVWQGDSPASWGAVPAPGRQGALLGLPPGSRLIGLCETHPRFRGQGLYVQALLQTVEQLRAAQQRSIYIEVLEDNHASIRGIERSGFRPLGRVDVRVFFGRLLWRNGRLGVLRHG